MATRDGQILDSDDDGRTWQQMADFAGADWESFLVTGGSTAATRVLAAYSPRKGGLMLAAGRLDPSSAVARNAGLYVGPYIKSGAECRANANGSVYYAAVNNVLWVARRTAAKAGPTIPASVSAACRPHNIKSTSPVFLIASAKTFAVP